jgi:agmatine/peptidylarginine deiminase
MTRPAIPRIVRKAVFLTLLLGLALGSQLLLVPASNHGVLRARPVSRAQRGHPDVPLPRLPLSLCATPASRRGPQAYPDIFPDVYPGEEGDDTGEDEEPGPFDGSEQPDQSGGEELLEALELPGPEDLEDCIPGWLTPDDLEPSAALVSGSHITLPAEFDTQAALLLACHELVPFAPDVFAAIVSAACGQVPVVAVVADDGERELVGEILEDHGLLPNSLRFLKIEHDTMWIRDYGPVVLVSADGSLSIADARYEPGGRMADDRFPRKLALLIGARPIDIPLKLDGGNLLTNGEGLCLSTLTVLAENDQPESNVRRALGLYYGCRETILLEPLLGERTGHVDMFATFTARDTVVVGQYDATADPENAALLDRNAARLSRVDTGRGPLRLVRVPMPCRLGEQWPTYTNVIYANGRLLVPVYAGDDPAERKRALGVFSGLLPAWDVVPIEADALAEHGGTLHCISRNVVSMGRLGRLTGACR